MGEFTSHPSQARAGSLPPALSNLVYDLAVSSVSATTLQHWFHALTAPPAAPVCRRIPSNIIFFAFASRSCRSTPAVIDHMVARCALLRMFLLVQQHRLRNLKDAKPEASANLTKRCFAAQVICSRLTVDRTRFLQTLERNSLPMEGRARNVQQPNNFECMRSFTLWFTF